MRARAEAMGMPYERIEPDSSRAPRCIGWSLKTKSRGSRSFFVSELAAGVTGQTINVDAGSIMN